jgi:YD repeat-containing protein
VTPYQRTLQLNNYAYDRVGNVLRIANALPPATQRRTGPVSLRYQYDALDRLVAANGTAEARPGVIDQFSASFAYSDIHNMMRNTQVHQIVEGSGQGEFPPHSNHDFDYQYTGLAPHQARRIGELKLTYDANGNTSVQCRAGLGICAGTASVDVSGLPASHNHWRRYDWTEENWLRQVTDGGGHETRFLYDASGQRVVKFGRGSPSVTIGQFFSVQGGHHATKHVFAGTERLASKLIPVAEQVALWQGGGGPTSSSPLLCATTGTVATGGCRLSSPTAAAPSQAHGALRSETYYYHPDHLGSTSWMTDHAGRVHEHVEYYPYGEVWRDSRRDDDPGPQGGFTHATATGVRTKPNPTGARSGWRHNLGVHGIGASSASCMRERTPRRVSDTLAKRSRQRDSALANWNTTGNWASSMTTMCSVTQRLERNLISWRSR